MLCCQNSWERNHDRNVIPGSFPFQGGQGCLSLSPEDSRYLIRWKLASSVRPAAGCCGVRGKAPSMTLEASVPVTVPAAVSEARRAASSQLIVYCGTG